MKSSCLVTILLGAFLVHSVISAPSNIDIDQFNAENGYNITGFKSAVSIATGDLNNDNVPDLLLADYTIQIIYVIYGGTDLTNLNVTAMTPAQGFTITGPIYTSWGLSIAVGDINNDGFNDIIVNGVSIRRVIVLFGKQTWQTVRESDIPANQKAYIDGPNIPSFGFIVRTGDVNGDNIDDLIMGNPGVREFVVLYGATGFTNLNVNNLQTSQGYRIAFPNSLTYSLSYAGDLNGDNIGDMLLGTTNLNSAYVVYGKSGITRANLDVTNLATVDGYRVFGANNGLGATLSGAGDLNNDGIQDFLVGDANPTSVYAIYGSSTPRFALDVRTLTPAQGYKIVVNPNGNYPGYALGGKDWNNDGTPDIVVGTIDQNLSPVYVIYGNSSNTQSVITAPNIAANEGFETVALAYIGTSYNHIEDMNQDNRQDLILQRADRSTVYVFKSGSSVTPPLPTVVLAQHSDKVGPIVIVFCAVGGAILIIATVGLAIFFHLKKKRLAARNPYRATALGDKPDDIKLAKAEPASA